MPVINIKKTCSNMCHPVMREKKPWKCYICDKNFTSRGVLKTHIEHVHEKIKPYSCNSCNHKSVTTADLKKHITAVHDKKKPYTCNICHKSYALSSTIYNFPHQNGK